MDEMHGHIYITGYKTSEEYKALYVYYTSMYADPITEGFDESLKQIRQNMIDTSADSEHTDSSTTEKQPPETTPADTTAFSDCAATVKKKSTAKNKVSEKHDKIKEKINEKNKKNSKKK